MQRTHRLIIIGVICLTSFLIHGDIPIESLLAEQDYETESEQEEPALSSPLESREEWESYNEWRCYSSTAINLICTEIDYGGWRKAPTIVAMSGGEHREYDLDPTFNWDCEFTLKEWRSLIENSEQVCFFGAYLQSIDDKNSLWILSQIKSEQGYWKEYESEAYHYTRREHEDFKNDVQSLNTQ